MYQLNSTTGATLKWETLKYHARSINPVPVRMGKKEYEIFKDMDAKKQVVREVHGRGIFQIY